MTDNLRTASNGAFLRVQADRCRRLSRSCMDLGAARDLRLMADDCVAEAARLETSRFQVATGWK
jgi:hypothetical protein